MSDPTDDGLLTAPKPSFDDESVAALLNRAYDVRGSLSKLGGERDQNIRVDVPDGPSYVLKISNPAEEPAALDLQTRALRHVRRTAPDLPVMELVLTTDDEPWTTVESDAERTHLVRLFTFITGRRAEAADFDADALRAYGATIARTGEALQGFFHSEARYDILWDLRNTLDLRERLTSVANPERRALADRALDRFAARVAPEFDSLRAQVVHNDLTLANVLFGSDDRVSGIVDFGDLTHTALVCDLAIPAARVMIGRSDPVAAAQRMVEGYVSVRRLDEAEARLLCDLVAARLVARGVIAAWRAEDHPENAAYITGGADESWETLRELDERGFDAVARQLRMAAQSGNVPYEPMDREELLSRRQRVLGPSPSSYDEPVHFVDGEGAWLFDPNGNPYLDAYNNVQVVGHGNPEVAAAIGGQARKLATNTRYLHESVVELGERLVATLPDGLDTVIPVNSGSEATDLAWRLAQASTGRDGAVVTDRAYHGITDATTALSPEVWDDSFTPDHVVTIDPPVTTSGGTRLTAADPAAAMTDAVATLDARGSGIAAFVFDSLFTSDGILPPQGDSLQDAAEVVREAGGLVVADEVQAGFGRCGSHLWGFETAGVVPDVVTLGKPMGNGHPVAAVVTRSDVAETSMSSSGVFSTFGGNPVSSVAALAVLDVIEEQNLLDQTTTVGEYLDQEIRRVLAAHGGNVRSRGLMLGVDLHESPTLRGEAGAVVDALRRERVLVGTTGPADDTLKIRPPLVFDRDQADRLVGAVETVLARY
ncbi:aminotransferase class III-fold pyridoxal phosphate-dependent enzyme [Haladaptatus sp. NG-WS-4]